MNGSEFQEELLSAYLDDELTVEQRQLVEQRLATDPAAQATLADLRRVREMVAKLPIWTGRSLQVDVPTQIPGSFDEAEDSTFEEAATGDRNDFEDVPRTLTGQDESPPIANSNDLWDANDGSKRSILAWGVTAASALLLFGIGYSVWNVRKISEIARQEAPAESQKTAAPGAVFPMPSDETAQSGQAVANKVGSNSRSAGDVEFGSNSALGTAEPAMPKLPASPELATEMAAMPDPSNRSDYGIPAPRSAMLNEPRSASASKGQDAPRTLEELTPPGPALDTQQLGKALDANAFSPQQRAGELINNEKDGLSEKTAGQTRLARSDAWKAEEVEASLADTSKMLGLSQNASLYYRNEIDANKSSENPGSKPIILMAKVKTNDSDSDDFYASVVSVNGLTMVDQSSDSLSTSRATANQLTEVSKDTVASDVQQRQMRSDVPRSDTLVLLVTRDEANRILAQLKEKEQVSPQVWSVIDVSNQSTEPAVKLNLNSDRSAVEKPAPVYQPETASKKPADKQTAGSDKVILLLSRPPK